MFIVGLWYNEGTTRKPSMRFSPIGVYETQTEAEKHASDRANRGRGDEYVVLEAKEVCKYGPAPAIRTPPK